MHGTAWTVFEGTAPEPMDLEILGILRGARGPGRDLILARLRGTKPEYTGVVAGMSGSPVYLEGKLLGALSYRIGQFSKDPIAGITPIAQMLEVRDLPLSGSASHQPSTSASTSSPARPGSAPAADTAGLPGASFTAIETPILMSGFSAEAVQLWKDRLSGSGLAMVSAGGGASSSPSNSIKSPAIPMLPGSAVSLQLMRGDMEIAATCTVTYIDPHQLLACGHPVLQAGPVSFPMTSTEVITTLASPLNAFKIVNTGQTIGAFTEDRDAAIRGELGVSARMIPISIALTGSHDRPGPGVTRHMEIVDLPSLTPSAVLVSIYQVLLESNQGAADMSYHVTGQIALHGQAPTPVDSWGTPGETMAPQLMAALGIFDTFNRLYSNPFRQQAFDSVNLHVESIPRDLRVELENVRILGSNTLHAGDRVEIEATLRPRKQPARNLRLSFLLPTRLQPGSVRLLISSAATLDRTQDAARSAIHPAGVAAPRAADQRLTSPGLFTGSGACGPWHDGH